MQKISRVRRENNKIIISNKARIVFIIVALVLFAIGSGLIIKSFNLNSQVFTEKREIYNYTDKYNVDAHVNLIENDYVKENEFEEGQTYLADLISSIDMTIDYEYKDSMTVPLTYDYSIDTIVKATYNANKGSYEVLNKSENIKKTSKKYVNSNALSIHETIGINYEKYHSLIKGFKQTMGINADSVLIVRLTVNTTSTVNGKEYENQFVSDYNITLGDKVALITENAKNDDVHKITEDVEIKVQDDINMGKVFVYSICMILGIVLLVFILGSTQSSKSVMSDYRLELNRIFKSYDDKIVLLQDLKQIDIEHATGVKDIVQLIKLSEEALVPIYCYIKEEPEEKAYFIVTKYEKSYIYILT